VAWTQLGIACCPAHGLPAVRLPTSCECAKSLRPDNGPENRQRLEVHYIGAEVELNYLPLFSELALLLPYTDIKLVFFGEPVQNLVQQAKKDLPGSLATKNIVWSYTAPEETGKGSIEIELYSEGASWTRLVPANERVPDAMVGLNAGLVSYRGWSEPILMSAILGIPFGVTEYAEQSMETSATGVATMRAAQASAVSDPDWHEKLTRKRPHPITTNPFHRPGQRPLPVVRMPNYYNGFCMPVVVAEQGLGPNSKPGGSVGLDKLD